MLFNTVRGWFSVPGSNPELAYSQFRALTTQIPLLYAILIVNTVALAASYVGRAPAAMAIYIPAILCACCLLRLIIWWRRRHQEVGHDEAIGRMRATVLLAAAFGVGFIAWGFALFPYGDAYAQSHAALYMAITVIGCVFCLTHLRAAALLVVLVVIPPLTAFLAMTGNAVFMAIAANIAFVALAMTVVLFSQYRDFTNLIEVQKELVAKNEHSQRLSDENFRLANFNQLTGLPKRRQFFTALAERIKHTKRMRGRLAIALVDLSGFRSINHIYGYSVGDNVLVEAGRRLRNMPGPPRFVARLGADEFGLIIDANLNDSELRAFGIAICDCLREPFAFPENPIQLAASIGLAAFPDAADDAHRLFERADYALYYAKQNQRGAAVVFTKRHQSEIYDLSLIHQELRRADLDKELSLVFQPIVDIDIQSTIGLEALARWQSPKLGAVQPDVFIAAAERLGLINRLSEVLLRKALATCRRWPEQVSLAFNLSPHDIASPEAMERLMDIVRESGVTPSRISFEVTETAAMRDFDQASKALGALKQLGARVALDDFGTGYSSLSHVRRLPLDELKIDRSFVSDIENDFAARDVVRTVMHLCQNLNLACVVEGTETSGQALILRSLGCRLMQGYLFSVPLSEQAVDAFLAAEREARQQVDDLPNNVRFMLDPATAAE